MTEFFSEDNINKLSFNCHIYMDCFLHYTTYNQGAYYRNTFLVFKNTQFPIDRLPSSVIRGTVFATVIHCRYQIQDSEITLFTNFSMLSFHYGQALGLVMTI